MRFCFVYHSLFDSKFLSHYTQCERKKKSMPTMFISDSSKNGWKFSEFVFCWFCWFILLHHTTKFNTNRTYSHTTQLRGLLENFIDIFNRTINRLWLNGVLFESALSTTRKRDKKNWRTRKIRANSKDRNSKEQIRIIERSQCDTNSFFFASFDHYMRLWIKQSKWKRHKLEWNTTRCW